jgi:hypothetical protein
MASSPSFLSNKLPALFENYYGNLENIWVALVENCYGNFGALGCHLHIKIVTDIF